MHWCHGIAGQRISGLKSAARVDSFPKEINCYMCITKVSLQVGEHQRWFDLARDVFCQAYLPKTHYASIRFSTQISGRNWLGCQLSSDPITTPVYVTDDDELKLLIFWVGVRSSIPTALKFLTKSSLLDFYPPIDCLDRVQDPLHGLVGDDLFFILQPISLRCNITSLTLFCWCFRIWNFSGFKMILYTYCIIYKIYDSCQEYKYCY